MLITAELLTLTDGVSAGIPWFYGGEKWYMRHTNAQDLANKPRLSGRF